MRREIRFRVWDGQQMEYNIIAGSLGVFYVQGLDEKDSASLSQFNTKYSEETHLMQFTGLHDKNGKKIWEGDLYQVANNKIYKIRYCDGEEHNYEWIGACFVLECNDIVIPFDEYAMKNGKVIGNIYENPLK